MPRSTPSIEDLRRRNGEVETEIAHALGEIYLLKQELEDAQEENRQLAKTIASMAREKLFLLRLLAENNIPVDALLQVQVSSPKALGEKSKL